jgi:hypothetical protein
LNPNNYIFGIKFIQQLILSSDIKFDEAQKLGIFSILELLVGHIESYFIFDIISLIAQRRFLKEFDEIVFDFITKDFSQPFPYLNHLIFGLKHDDNYIPKGLCFPSLVSLVGNIELQSSYDIEIFSKYGLEHWLEITGESIENCPFIISISHNYIQRSHFCKIIHNPDLLKQCLNFDSPIQKIEFLPNSKDSIMEIKYKFPSEFSFSFWFQVDGKYSGNGDIFTIGQYSICIQDFQVLLKGNSVDDESHHHFVKLGILDQSNFSNVLIIVSSKNDLLCYFNGEFKCSQKNISSQQEIRFGSSNSSLIWYLIGNSSFYNFKLKKDQISSIFTSGPTDHPKQFSPVKILHFQYFKRFNPHLRINESLPLVSYFIENKKEFLLKIIIENIEMKCIEKAQKYFEILCEVQLHKKFLGISEYSTFISSIIDICPIILNCHLFDLSLQPFSQEESTDFRYIIFYLLRYGMIKSKILSDLLNFLLKYIEQIKKYSEHLIHQIFTFTIRVLTESQLSDSLNSMITSIWSNLNLPPVLISRAIILLSKSQISVLSDHFLFLIHKFLNSFNPKVDRIDFLILLSPELTETVINLIFKKCSYSPPYDLDFLMICCLQHCYHPGIWNCALSLLTTSQASIDNIKLPKFNEKLFGRFIVMMTILLRACFLTPENSGYLRFACQILHLILESIQNVPISKDVTSGISLLMTCGVFRNTYITFPFTPTATTIQESVEMQYNKSKQSDQNISNSPIPFQDIYLGHSPQEFDPLFSTFEKEIQLDSIFHNLELSFSELISFKPNPSSYAKSNFIIFIDNLTQKFKPTEQTPFLLESAEATPISSILIKIVSGYLKKIFTQQPKILFEHFQLLFYPSPYLHPKDQFYISHVIMDETFHLIQSNIHQFPCFSDFLLSNLVQGWIGNYSSIFLDLWFLEIRRNGTPQPLLIFYVVDQLYLNSFPSSIIDKILEFQSIIFSDSFLFPFLIPIFGKWLIQFHQNHPRFQNVVKIFLDFCYQSRQIQKSWPTDEISYSDFIENI